jgi:hypothetical protein
VVRVKLTVHTARIENYMIKVEITELVPHGAGKLYKSRQLATLAEISRFRLTERSREVTVENDRLVQLMVVIKDALVSPSAAS